MLATLLVLLVIARLAIPRLSSSVAAGPVENNGVRVEPFAMRGSTDETIEALVELLDAEPRTEVVRRESDYLHATVTTMLMGYIDDLEFLVDEVSSTVHVRSASRIGKSDLGANAKRIDALRERWIGAIPAAKKG